MSYLRLGFERRIGRYVLDDLGRVAPLIVQQALYWDEAMPELPICMVTSLGGGTLQGDRLTIVVNVGDDACGHVTTQGANRVHAMDANHALLGIITDGDLRRLMDPSRPAPRPSLPNR